MELYKIFVDFKTRSIQTNPSSSFEEIFSLFKS